MFFSENDFHGTLMNDSNQIHNPAFFTLLDDEEDDDWDDDDDDDD